MRLLLDIKKRYSDIEELLRAGIDVYTTVNVQHIESLHDVVESITKVKLKKRCLYYFLMMQMMLS